MGQHKIDMDRLALCTRKEARAITKRRKAASKKHRQLRDTKLYGRIIVWKSNGGAGLDIKVSGRATRRNLAREAGNLVGWRDKNFRVMTRNGNHVIPFPLLSSTEHVQRDINAKKKAAAEAKKLGKGGSLSLKSAAAAVRKSK